MSPARIYWVSKPAQLRVLSSPLRHDIVDRLTALGPLPVAALARSLGRQQTAIYRHLRTLEKSGLVRRLNTKGGRGRPATTYAAAAPVMRLARAPNIPGNRPPMARMARFIARQAAREYQDGFRSPNWTIEGAARNHWFFRLFAAPSPAKLARINKLLDELAELIWTPDPNPGRLMSVSWFMSPVAEAQSVKRIRRGKASRAGVRTTAPRRGPSA